MPTKKPIIQAVTEQEIYEKIKKISEKEDMSISKTAGIMLSEYIEIYENQYGTIEIQKADNEETAKRLLKYAEKLSK